MSMGTELFCIHRIELRDPDSQDNTAMNIVNCREIILYFLASRSVHIASCGVHIRDIESCGR